MLEVAAGLFGGACLLRLFMQWQRVPFGNPIGRFVFAITDWLVLPLRKVLPAIGRIDTASLVAAYLIECAQWLLILAMRGHIEVDWLLGMALFGLIRLAISAMMALVLVYAILSWIQNDSPMADVIDRLCEPLLRPIRKVLPLVGGLDLSPLVLLVLLQVALMVLTAAFRGF
nr:YggT family protein [Ramlibacter algicola]